MQSLPHMHVLQNQDFFKFTSSNIMNLGNYKTYLLQILIIFMIWLLEAMRKWYYTTSSYCWPPNQGFSSSLSQTQRTWGITKHFSYRYWLFYMMWLLEAMRKWYHTTSSYWWPPNQGFSSLLPQTQRTWGITKPFSYRYWLFFMIWLLWALMKRYHATSS